MRRFILALILIVAVLPIGSAFASQEEIEITSSEGMIAKAKADFYSTVALSCAFAMAIAAFGAALGQSLAARKALEGVARQPEAAGKLQTQMILTLVFIETLAIYTLVVALILLFANPFMAAVGTI